MQLIFILLLVISFVFCFKQSVQIEVQLTCDGIGEQMIEGFLYSSDDSQSENRIASGLTDNYGKIVISGRIDSEQKMKPIFVFQHRCGIDFESECYKVLTIHIPDEYVFRGGMKEIENVYDVGTVNLGHIKFPNHFAMSSVCP